MFTKTKSMVKKIMNLNMFVACTLVGPACKCIFPYFFPPKKQRMWDLFCSWGTRKAQQIWSSEAHDLLYMNMDEKDRRGGWLSVYMTEYWQKTAWMSWDKNLHFKLFHLRCFCNIYVPGHYISFLLLYEVILQLGNFVQSLHHLFFTTCYRQN